MEKDDQFPNEDEELEIMEQQSLKNLQPLISGDSSLPSGSKVVQSNCSQISNDFGEISGIIGGPVNRRLFSLSSNDRITSTPLMEPTKFTTEQLAKITESEEIIQETESRPKRRYDRDPVEIALYENSSYTDPVAKKLRKEEERDLEAIERIRMARRHIGDINKKTSNHNVLYLQQLHDFKMKNLSTAVPQWPFLPLYQGEQNLIFVRFHSSEYENRMIEDISVKPSYGRVLGDNRQQLWDEANDIVLKRAQLRSNNDSSDKVTSIIESEECLWVEKYKPKKYRDLLSAETTNRSLLLWLKMWDKAVFGREFKMKSNTEQISNKLNTFNKRTGKFESNGGWFQRRSRANLDTNIDEHGRPLQKVALLHGPPGLGKTTLAHILARHAGYQPLEINASDDRSPAAFQQTLENGTQMTSLLNEEQRPNCIILDEIDGAPRQSIEFLIKFVNDNVQNKRLKGGKKINKNILKRPIICICNDVYESALRPLRLIAFLVQFPPIEVARLEERLKQIAITERLKADITALYALAQKTGNDVRCCVSFLQFLKSENKSLTLHDVLSSSIGRKDQHQGLFTVWSKIFQIQRTQKHQQMTENSMKADESVQNDSTRARIVLDSVQAAGDYQRLMTGVYENFLNQKMCDPNMFGVVEALDWFCFFDNIQHKINHQQNYSIYPYLQLPFVKWHLLFSSLTWSKINFPTRGNEFNQKSSTQKNIFDSLCKAMLQSSGVLSLGNGKTVLLEAVPYLKRIISPELRHLPIELFSQREREVLKHTVEVMADLGITYIQVKSSEGSYHFQMEPDLEALVQFPEMPGVSLSYFGRQMLAREIETERINRFSPKIIGTNNVNSAKCSPNLEAKKLPNHLQKLQPKVPTNVLNKQSASNAISKYFRNMIRVQSNDSSAPSTDRSKDPIVKSPIWYHYKEGFNNAVRKDVEIKELL